VVEEVLVTGFRQSIARSLDNKRDSFNAKESIVAEDMGKMPDLNLAEAMQRVPGVAILRQGGEGRQISLRGLGAGFTHVTLNGMEVPSSTAGLDSGGGTNRGRSFDFNVFSADLFNRIDINKSAMASEEEGGIAGSVNLYSMRPLDSTGTNVVVSAQAAYNDLSEETEPRLTAIYRGNNEDETIGWMLSGSYTERTSYQDGFGTVRWTSPAADGNRAFNGSEPMKIDDPANPGTLIDNPNADEFNSYWYPRIPRQDSFHHEQDRLGLSAGLQFRPTDSLDFSLNYVASEFENTIDGYNSFGQFRRNAGYGWPVITPILGDANEPFVVAQNGSVNTVTAGTFEGVGLRTESRRNTNNTDFSQITADFEWSINDDLVLSGMLGSASSDFSQDYFRVNIQNLPEGTAAAGDGLRFRYDFTGDSDVAAINYFEPGTSNEFDTTNPANFWIMNNERIRRYGVDRQNDTVRLDLAWNLSDEQSFKFGLITNSRSVESTEYRQDVETIPANSELANIGKVYTYDDTGGYGSGTDLQFWVLDFDKAIPQFGTQSDNYSLSTGDGSNTWEVEEDTVGLYAEYNFETEFYRLNAGVRHVSTDVTATGYANGELNPEDNSFDNFLPAVNINFDITEDMIGRIGVARTMTRPGLSSLVPIKTYSANNTTVTGGNSQLGPLLSNDINLSWEWYFAEDSLVALNVFVKSIESFISRPTVPDQDLRPEDQAVVASLFPEQPELLDSTWTYSTATNTTGSTIKGWELAYQQMFTSLPGILSNTGILANLTSVDGTTVITRNDIDENAPIPGMSETSYNFTAFYEDDTWGARFSLNNRDDYVTKNIGSNGNFSEVTEGNTQLDFSSHYNVNDMITLRLEIVNLTDEYERLYVTGPDGASNLTREYNHTGRQLFFGVRTTF